MCLSAILVAIMINLSRKEEDYRIPFSDREHRMRRLQESIYHSGIYSLILFLHNLVFIFLLRDPFSMENATYLLLLNLLIFLLGVETGLSIGIERKQKDASALRRICSVIDNFVGGFVIGQSFDLLILKGALYQRFGIFFLNPSWYVWTILVRIAIECISMAVDYRNMPLPDYAIVHEVKAYEVKASV